jgi:glucoamylase
MDIKTNQPLGWPGTMPRWTSSSKTGVGTSLNSGSRVWFTLNNGIFTEIYYPRLDQACVKDMGLIVTDGVNFFSDEKQDTEHKVSYMNEGVPAYKLVNTCKKGYYRIEKEIITDPERDVVLQNTCFTPLKGSLSKFHLYVLMAPHLANHGSGNTACFSDYKGVPMFFAEYKEYTLALATSVNWLKKSVGFVGYSDGFQDIMHNKQITSEYERAENGNVAITGEVDLLASKGKFLLALGFGRNAAEAGNRALASLLGGFEKAKNIYINEWNIWQQQLLKLDYKMPSPHNIYRISASVLRTHEAKHISGGLIASLSIPWGFSKGDDDIGGYHLVWTRDLVEAAGALLAAGAKEDVLRVLHYLQSTQEHDGYWPQNMWVDGTPYWKGIQMDETAFPILLVDLARRERAINKEDQARLWPMIWRAASFLVRNGPVTQQDRWEEDPGYSPFTLAVEISALLAAADLADLNHEPKAAAYLRETADIWNANIERWVYVTGTEIAKRVGVDGYYVRIAPPEVADAASPAAGFVPIKNRPVGQSTEPAVHIVSPDALALVRFGLRAPDDPRIVNTVKVIDALLKMETPHGPAWHRYNDDGYGEHADGSPFDGTGIGRVWPLLTGERAHYELLAGHRAEAERLSRTIEAFANKGGMIPEQIWDAPDIPEMELFFGRPSGSAMPLVWAHAEYIKLIRSMRDGQVFDMPPQTVHRYVKTRTDSSIAIWRFNHKCRTMAAGKTLRVELLASANVHWSSDDWRTIHDANTRDTGLGLYVVDLPTASMPAGSVVWITFYWIEADIWENTNFSVNIKENV